MTGDLLIENLAEVATPEGSTPRRGPDQGRVLRTRHPEGVEVLCRSGRIEFVGAAEVRRERFGDLPDLSRLDGKRGTLIPGFVDPHTHIPWAGTRETELFERLAGKTYQAIAAEGGGILSTVAATRRASEDEITGNVLRHLDWMLAGGTTTIEAKSGYGLNLADEVKQLVALNRAAAEHPVRILPTLLAAHEVPAEHRADPRGRARYVELICDEIVPEVAARGLARFCDVFCEAGVFSPEESRRVLEAGIRHGLAPRLHADEFADSGGAELAAELGALSADHLMAVSDRGIEALAGSGVTAVLLPGTSFFLKKERYAPARRMIEAGIPVALATDCNPGSSYTESMPMIVTLAVFQLGLSVEESLTAATLNAACCLGVGDETGTIVEGKRADLALLDAPNLLHLAYHYGVNPIAAVVRDGRLVYRSGGRIV